MKMTEWFLAQLEAEAVLSRRTLERVPDGRSDWKPHEKSMPLVPSHVEFDGFVIPPSDERLSQRTTG